MNPRGVSQQPVTQATLRDGVLHVVVAPLQYSFAAGKIVLSDIARQVQERRPRAVLLDATAVYGRSHLLPRARLTFYVAGLHLDVPIALVMNESFINPDRVTQHLARRLGINVIEFTTVADALDWIARRQEAGAPARPH